MYAGMWDVGGGWRLWGAGEDGEGDRVKHTEERVRYYCR